MVLEGFRISPQQDRIWSLNRGARHPICGNRCAIRIHGELDRAALTAAWRSLVKRHEILRIQLHPLPGLTQPVQAATGGDARWLPDRDLTGLAPEPIAELLDELGREPFTDDRGPSAVLSLLRLDEREHVLLLALPAFQSDAVGLRNVARELALCYAAAVEGRPLEGEPLPYTGVADWLLELLESEEAEAGKKHWSRIDLSPLAELRLPREARPVADADPAAATGTVALELGPDRLALLDELTGRLRVAPETFLLACWQAFLARSTRQGRGLGGVAFTGRTDEELEVALGPLARVLPVPWGIEPETPLSVVVQALEKELDEARQWQECFTWKPLERAIEKLGVEPFFPYAFEAVSLADRFPAAGVTFSVEHLSSCTDRFALRLFAVRRPEGLRLEIQHDRTRFAPAEAGRWADRFATFLESALASPQAAVDDLEMINAAEREHLLRDYNRTAAGLPLDRCLHEHFEAQAKRSPGEVAVELGGVELSYAELNARANQLGHCLRELGAGPESLVGICLDRSIEMVVALLGVLKAGAAWLPLDPGYPTDRLAFMLEDARPRVLLTLSGTRDDIAARADRVLVLDRMEEELARRPRHNPATWTGSDVLAYMIYTSGSTGRPKGVMVRHRSIANRLLWMLDRFPLAADDRVLFKTPFSFDASIWEIFVPLFAGARLVVARPDGHQDPSYLVRTVIDREITVLQLVPSLLRMVLDEPGFPACRSLRRLFSGGEALTGDLVERFYASGLTAGLHNLYGPTEVAIDATCWSCRRDDAQGAVPIGHPIANAEVYLLDAAGRVVPEGMSGELHVGGVGPARGYHRRPELTAERFLPDACSGRTGDRLYKTGDLARYREDGSLEFLGRIDHQVKVRGFRIELGEIEARLRSHRRVHESVVVARRDEQGRDRLVAYVVPRQRGGDVVFVADLKIDVEKSELDVLTPERLRSFLGERLPEHMVPSVFVLVDSLPLSPNGKIDRKALAERPLPEREGERPGVPRIAPASDAERVLAEIWRELLQVDEVSTADNFFELGGDSILCIQIVSRARRAGLWFSPRDLFQNQTIAKLALVAQTAPGPATGELEGGEIPLAPSQRSFFERSPEDLHHYNQALVLALREKVDPGLLERALAAVVAHHTALRLRYIRREGGEWSQTPADTIVPLRRMDLSLLPAERRAAALEAVAAQLQTSLDIERGPLLRAALFDLGEGEQRLFLVAHHLIVDGVSWRILLDDLETACRAAAEGADIVLPPVITSLRQWVARLAEHARSAAGEAELAYWLALDERKTCPLPVDRESGRDTMVSARHLVAELSEEETRELLRDVPAVYRTRVNDVLLTALAQAFTAWTGAPRLLVDLEGHGREDLFDGVDLSRTVGWLTAVHPVLLELDPQETDPGERLKSIKEQLRAAPRGGLGYGVLRALGEGATVERLRARSAAQVIFNYLGQLDQGLPASSLFAPASEPAGPSQSWRQERPWLLEINGGVAGGRLRLIWTYSENRHEAHTIQGVIDRFLGALRALIGHCRTAEPGSTPSDFPEARVSREDLDRLLARLGARQRDIETLCELTPMQQALLFHSLYSPGSGVYMMQISLRMTGRLDVAAFLRSWQRAIERHDLLRTGFGWEKLEKPLQVVYRHVDLPVERTSWTGLDVAEQRGRLAAYLDEDRERGFDLTVAPLIRLALFDLGPQEHQLVWTQHHLVSDGWSQGLLLGELFTCYGAFVAGREPSLGPERSFRDYIVWLQRQDLAEAEAFWRRRLAGFVAPTLLAGGDGRGAARPDLRDPRQRSARVPAETMAALRELARQNHLTPNTLVQGAWSLLLAQAIGEDEVVFGNTVAGRPPELPGAEAIFGVFINTLPVRVAVDPGLQLLSWLAALQESQAETQRYEFAPLSQVQSWSDLPPGVALFDHILVSESYPLDGAVAGGLPGLTISEVSTSELTHYPLSLAFLPGPELLLDMTWDGSRFDAATVVRLLERLQGLLRAFAEDPRRRLGELPLLLPEERHQLVYEWNESVAPPARWVSFLTLFERQVDRAPDAPALSHADGTRLTYGELDRRANRLAHRLRRLGAAADMRVAVLAERSPELIVSLLGILKAGAAYVPLDPGYPPERLAFMLEDSGAAILLTGKRWMDRLPASPLVPRFLDEGLESESAERPQREHDPGEIAYVLYTSGSTGRPKGVMVSHGALARFAELVEPLYEIRPGDRVLQFCSISFDISLDEIVSSLSHGAELVLRTDAMLESVAVFLETCRQQAVTVLELPTAYWHEVIARLDTDGLSLPSCLRLVVIGGERALHHRVVAWRRHAPEKTRLLNCYGVTEATISSTWADLASPSAAEGRGEVSIGRPFPDVDLYLLDRAGAPIPLGVAGELHIGGSLLARGYLNRPDLTAERFVPHPFSPVRGSRLYRTGDLARVLPDGALELVGRGDRQVKVRGYRIEVEEIEARLLQHPEVESALVIVREDSPGDKRIVGYLVLRRGQGLDLSRLPVWLRETLPDYMVPSAFVVLEALPLTPNGKVDREALPAPERAPFGLDGMAAPSDPVEELLAGIWSEVLGLGRVGVHDDFFALGGHSLLATQVMSRLRNVLGVELPLRRLFESPTVAALARDVREARQEEPAAPPIVPVPRDRDLPLSFAQQRLWLIDQLDPGSPVYNLPMALRLSGELIPSLLERLFAEIVRRHEALRTTFEVRAGEPVQVIALPGDPALWPGMPVVDLSHLPGAERETEALALARAEARRPFDLRRGPLLRFALLRLAGSEHVLLMTMHHIISDGWSMGVLVREVAALHAAFSQGLPSPLPELAVQYADYAVWQRGWLRGATLDDQIDHWKRRLAGAPRVLELPTDRPRPAVQTARGALQPVALPSALSERVRELCRREGVTPFMLLLAGWAVLLGRHAGQEDVLVGTPIAGRTRREIEDLIGFFVNTLALRVDWARSEALAFRGLLGQVRETALDAFAHQDLPFERLVEELVPERSLAFSPLVQVLFALQNAPAGALSLPGLSLASVALDSGTSKLDLTLSLGEGPAGFSGGLEHNTDLFDPATAERLATRFAALLEAAVAEPGRAVPDLPLLLPAELEQVLWTGNATRTGYPREVSLPELYAEVARERPEAPAVVGAGGEVWSYGRLDEESNRLARRLLSLGVRPETAVGLSMERSPELILGILAIVKAGGVYVPLDASYPDERLRFMLEDTAARLVLVHAATRQRLASMAQVLDVEEGRTEDAQALDVRVAAASLAYVIYTSGSTGWPKGVAVPHQAIVRLVRATNYAHLGPGDRTAHVANISFDAATWEIWGALLNGAAVAVIPRETVLDPPAFAAALREQRVTSMFLTSALFTRMSREVPDAFEPLGELLVGGEAVDPVAARKALAGRPPRRLLNVYGPTESTTYASWYPIREVPAEAASIPIGFPLANTTLYVLDRRQRPVPPGVTGELLIGGDGLARGYLNRPELTAELFLPHPWGTGERLYRSGDLARHRPDGSIELLGRLDDQVKIRGFRIEPGEIESVLWGHPEVREAAVLARREGVADRGETRLVAYVTGYNGQAPRGEVLRDWLRERLPEHMLPSSFVILEEMPLTANGKLDRRALPAPESTRSLSGSYVAPSNPVEEKLAGVWADLLQIGRVGVDDDFFALGGHSLLATQVVTQVREALGMELPLRHLFQAPTIRQLARSLSGVLMVRLSGELSVDALERALGELGQEIAPPGDLPVLDLSDVPDDAREEWALQLVLEEGRSASGDEGGPLPRFGLLRLGSQEHLLLVTQHVGAERE